MDGCDPEYLRGASVPNIRRLGGEGICVEGVSMVPTVTNVNNVSLTTGEYPEKHGITANCYFDRASGREVYMESPGLITSETIFEKAAQHGLRSVLVTAKEKLRALLSRGAEVSVSAEDPPSWVTEKIGRPPSIYSLEVNEWLFNALQMVMPRLEPDLAYLVTTDYAMHKYRPGDPRAREHMALLDSQVGRLMDSRPNTPICVTADHGMSDKDAAVNLHRILEDAGVSSHVVPTVKDRYLPHHSNLSGSAYVYLADEEASTRAHSILREAEGVESILTREEAASEYRLPRDRIGDFMVLAGKRYVFGRADDQSVSEVHLRSHGSLHEQRVPIILKGLDVDRTRVKENRDLCDVVLEWLLGE